MAVNGVFKQSEHDLQIITTDNSNHARPRANSIIPTPANPKSHAPLERQDSVFGVVSPMNVAFQHIDVFSKPAQGRFKMNRTVKPKHILRDVSGEVKAGQLLAIMGASGAGKTTLLNVLTGRSSLKLQIEGRILINDKPVGKNIKRVSSYVQQQDLFMGTLTVKEHLTFQALLRMDTELDHHTRMERVEQALIELGLTKCANTKIGIPGRVKGISGGEMKRLTFASEVLTNPCLMFCDEPTSGLDAYMAHSVIAVLRKMAAEGRTIICTIHQPASDTYAMFDQILLMAEGRVAYMGPRRDALTFLSSVNINCPPNYNPADYFIDQLAVVPGKEEICRDRIKNVCDMYLHSEHCYNPPRFEGQHEVHYIDGDKTSMYKTSACTQIWVLFRRSFIVILREKSVTAVRILQTVVIAILLSLLYSKQTLNQESIQNINGALFIIITNMTFQNISTILIMFGLELKVFLREHANGMYRSSTYFFSKTLAEMPIFIMIPVIYVSIIYFAIGLANGGFGVCLFVAVLVSNVACSYAYMISCIFSHPGLVAVFGFLLVSPLMLLGGLFLNPNSVPIYFEWMKYLSWFYYGNEALQINQWRYINDISCGNASATCMRTGLDVLNQSRFNPHHMWFDIGILGVLLVVFRLLAVIGLVLKVRSNQ